MTHGETISGRVVKVNGGSGFQVEGSEWLHLSKWCEGGTRPPAVGDVLEVKVDNRGFVRSYRIAAEAPAPTAPPASSPGVAPAIGDDRRITRLAVLNTATAILSSGGRATTGADVATLAARLEAWVYRSASAGKGEVNNG